MRPKERGGAGGSCAEHGLPRHLWHVELDARNRQQRVQKLLAAPGQQERLLQLVRVQVPQDAAPAPRPDSLARLRPVSRRLNSCCRRPSEGLLSVSDARTDAWLVFYTGS